MIKCTCIAVESEAFSASMAIAVQSMSSGKAIDLSNIFNQPAFGKITGGLVYQKLYVGVCFAC